MKTEIERKFLVDPKRIPILKKGTPIIQAYFSSDPEIRARIQGRSGFITIKTRGLVSRGEFEYKIPFLDAEKLIDLSTLKIEKVRCKIPLDTLVWEIDFYKGENRPLVLAEVELPKEKYKFKKPLWVIKEVTNNLRYRNINLAKRPFTTWRGVKISSTKTETRGPQSQN
jgi:adenylate cyclase